MAKIKEIEAPKDTSMASLKGILEKRQEDHYNDEETVRWKISSGSLLLDAAMGGITPSLIRLCGTFGSGKSAESLEIVRNFLASIPNSKGFWILAEGRLSDEHKERCGLKFVSNPEDWVPGTVFLLESNIYELIVESIRELMQNNPTNNKYCFVLIQWTV